MIAYILLLLAVALGVIAIFNASSRVLLLAAAFTCFVLAVFLQYSWPFTATFALLFMAVLLSGLAAVNVSSRVNLLAAAFACFVLAVLIHYGRNIA